MEFSDKQKLVLTTFLKSNNYFTLLSGALRSGKSYIAVLAFFLYTQSLGANRVNVIVGRNLRIMEIELLETLKQMANKFCANYSYKSIHR